MDSAALFSGNSSTQAAGQHNTTLRSATFGDSFETKFISNAALQVIETMVNAGILPVLVLCGVIGNVINMAVFARQGLKDRVNLCLFFLSLSDLGFLVFYMFSRIYILFYFFDSAMGDFWKACWFYFIGVYDAFLNASDYLTVVLSLERCLCVISPLRAKNLLSARGMQLIVAALFAVSTAGNWMACVKYKTVVTFNPGDNATKLLMVTTSFYYNNLDLFNVVYELVFNVIVPTSCLVVVTAATLVIAVRMHAVLVWRKESAHVGLHSQSTSANRREAALTRMLLAVCVVYTICITPPVIQAFLRVHVPGFVAGGRYNNVFVTSLCISHLLESVNCSIHFIIYNAMSTRFRDTLRNMACTLGKRKGCGAQESKTRASLCSLTE